MTQKIVVEKGEWTQAKKGAYCEHLEEADILFFPEIPFAFPQEEIDFLLNQKQGSSQGRKNIAYKPGIDQVTNHETQDPEEKKKMHRILKNYSQRVCLFLQGLLSPYAPHWKLDYASFRPFQEKGRKLRLRARNDLLHVDSFPTRPMHGSRILRFFTNINPVESRHWMTSDPFEKLLLQFGNSNAVGLPQDLPLPILEKGKNYLHAWLHRLGILSAVRSPYDRFMLNMHNFLKENAEFQKNCPKKYFEFPPNSCWAVFTDQVSHAALSGQYALEQTIFIPQNALIFPEKSPLANLEKFAQRPMVFPSGGCGNF